MFSLNAIDNTKLIEVAFIAGLNAQNINGIHSLNLDIIKSENFQIKDYKADILLSFPERKELITQSILDVKKF
jgi:hypothetical protein